jgi:hypothetical protein
MHHKLGFEYNFRNSPLISKTLKKEIDQEIKGLNKTKLE